MLRTVKLDADRFERGQIKRLEILWRRFQDYLELIEMLQPVRIFAVAPILGAARGLHVGGLPRARAERAQRRGRMERAGAHFEIIGLEDDAAMPGPESLQG